MEPRMDPRKETRLESGVAPRTDAPTAGAAASADAGCLTHRTPNAIWSAACCGRRGFLAGLGALGAAALLPGRDADAQAPAEKPFRIDTHHHLSSPAFIAEIDGRRTGQTPLIKWTPQQTLADMDAGGVATSILSISEPGVFFGNYPAARALARETNEYGAKLISQHPGRFGMYATVPMPDVEGTLREIEYALDTLKMDGICMMTDYQGKFLGDPAFAPVMQELNRRKAIVYTHPFRNECCRNLIPGIPEPVIELGTDTTRTITSIVFTGTAERLPDIRWIFSHAGGTAPYLMQRFDIMYDNRKDLQALLPKRPAEYLQRFFYDTASASTINPLASLTKLVRPTQILFGTDFPFNASKQVAAELRATNLFTADELRMIERGNATRLMPRYAA